MCESNVLKEFINHVSVFVLKSASDGLPRNLVRLNSEKLAVRGDVCILNDASIWFSSYKQQHQQEPAVDSLPRMVFGTAATVDDSAESNNTQEQRRRRRRQQRCTAIYNVDDLTAASKHWTLHVQRIALCSDDGPHSNRCLVWLDRACVYQMCVPRVLQCNELIKTARESLIKIHIESEAVGESVTEYRRSLLVKILKNCINASDVFAVVAGDDESPDYRLHITNKSSLRVDANVQKLISGNVIDPRMKHTLASQTAEEYIRKRSVDMRLMAQHKYGLRVNNERVFVKLIDQLGTAAVTFDFMEVKYSSPVNLNTVGCSTSKGASFVLYNSARIETILRKFNEKVECGYYQPLPTFDEIDVGLLKEEEEWQLMFVYVLRYPDLIEKVVGDVRNGRVAPHLICSYLCELVGLFSIYYRRCRVLTEITMPFKDPHTIILCKVNINLLPSSPAIDAHNNDEMNEDKVLFENISAV